ncbi:Hvo_1808 family surface protein [Haladaptatus caseinilyticus]|uniref:Hvo_1808 family surface protein n=1 Tax=Haladaptatus caseinilyticus TaxID=2993314 RepID=UPI00224B41C5|nr:Hvo_1808 family surface protein [Haladaptatus caseinilyticus]
MRTITAVAVALMLVLAGCSSAPGDDTTTSGPDVTNTTQDPGTTAPPGEKKAIHPADPDDDVLGWEEGYWFNETISVTRDDGLNESELDAVVSRSMARVEKIRDLEFERKVPVKVISRDQFRSEQDNQTTPPKRRLFDNVKFEALMMIDESTDSIAVQSRNSGSSVGGYYSPGKESIVIISNNQTSPKMNEITLSQELFHALQDQTFDLKSFDQSTRERHNAIDGVIEGDGNYLDYLYEQRCNSEWKGTCLMSDKSESSGGGQLANIGPYLVKYQPYSDGPPFVKRIHEKQGWKGVNDLYKNPPASTEQVIHPKKYPNDKPAQITVRDTTSNGWKRLKPKGRPNFGEVGEAGIFSMLMYPYYESQGSTQILPARKFFNMNNEGKLKEFDPLNYRSKATNGWDGDKIVVYTNDDTATNETGYVFKTKWDSKKDATEFVDAYKKLLNYRNAKQVDSKQNTWRVPDSTGFGDAFYIQQNGDTVVIVNAPTVSDLSDVRHGSAPNA